MTHLADSLNVSSFIKPLPVSTEAGITHLTNKAKALTVQVHTESEHIQARIKAVNEHILSLPATQSKRRKSLDMPEKTLSEGMKNHLRIVNNDEYYALLQSDMIYTKQFQDANRPSYETVKHGKKLITVPHVSAYSEGQYHSTITQMRVKECIVKGQGKNQFVIAKHETFPMRVYYRGGNGMSPANNATMSTSKPLFELNVETGKFEITKPLGERLRLWEMEAIFEALQTDSIPSQIANFSPYAASRLFQLVAIGIGKNKETRENTPTIRNQASERKSEIIARVFEGNTLILLWDSEKKKNVSPFCKNFPPMFRLIEEREIQISKANFRVWFAEQKGIVKKSGIARTLNFYDLTVRFEYE